MPRRINADTDMQILADIGLGQLNKDVAEKYGVSASYVSKLSSGKKVPDIHIPEQNKSINFEAYTKDLEGIIEFVSQVDVLIDDDAVERLIKAQINQAIIHAKVYIELLKKYKGGE